MSLLKAPSNLPELVKTTFSKALAANELHYFPTQVTILHINSIPFQLRFSPALANKPKGPPPDPAHPRKPFDPFANPPASLFITDLGHQHYLVLNKFAVVPEHFFNGGDHSGASQPHRHIQLLPISRMRDGLETSSSWEVLAQQADSLDKTPFVAFSEPISIDTSSENLHAAYLRLYRKACQAVAQHTHAGSTAPTDDEVPSTGEAKISYNMAMTKDRLVICPRLSDGCEIRDAETSSPIGFLALNGTVLAGTALVKSEAEWEALKKSPDQLLDVLKSIGVPREEYQGESNKL